MKDGREKVGQSALKIPAECPFRNSSPLSLARQPILRNQGGVMGHDHVLNIESGTVANSSDISMSNETTTWPYLMAADPTCEGVIL